MKKNKQEEQFTMIPHSLMGRKDLTDQDKLTLGVILSFVNNDKECYIGNDRFGNILGISKKAVSKRVLRLESLGCIKLDYTYKEGKKEVDKRFITFITIEPQVSPVSGQGISSQETRVSHQEIGYLLTDDRVSPVGREEVSPKGGGIIQPSLLDNLLNNSLNKVPHTLPHNELNNENPMVEEEYECEPELMLNEIEEQLELEQQQLELMLDEISIEEQLELVNNRIIENNFKTNDERGKAFMLKEKLQKELKQLTIK
jgi:DNA-binding Lrp family transcriptional regulator